MGRLDTLKTIPVGSLLTLPERESDSYFNSVAVLPATLKTLLTSVTTGAFTRGLAKSYGLPEEQSATIALAILRVTVGAKSIAQLPELLAELSLSNDKAEKMAKEIEDDLFGPVKGELEAYWRSQKDHVPERRAARNVLNLKEEKKPPVPPPMPKD